MSSKFKNGDKVRTIPSKFNGLVTNEGVFVEYGVIHSGKKTCLVKLTVGGTWYYWENDLELIEPPVDYGDGTWI